MFPSRDEPGLENAITVSSVTARSSALILRMRSRAHEDV